MICFFCGDSWVVVIVGVIKLFLFISGILFKVFRRYCNGLLVGGDGVFDVKFDGCERVKGDFEVL